MTPEIPNPQRTDNKPFFSLKWKTLIVIVLVFIFASSAISYSTYSQGIQLFQSQLAASIRNNSSALLAQSRRSLIDIATIVSTFAKQASAGNSELALANFLAQNWDIISLEWGLESLMLLEGSTEILQAWGVELQIDVQDLIKDKNTTQPQTEIVCAPDCSIYAIVPMYFIDGEKRFLIVGQGIEDFVMGFAQKNALKAALLRVSDANDQNAQLASWKASIAGMTERERYFPIIKKLAERTPFEKLSNKGKFITMPEGNSYYLYATPIIENGHTNEYLLLASDISQQRYLLYESLIEVILITLLGLIGVMALIFLVLNDPMRRIQRQANLLPLLAKREFAKARENTTKHQRKRYSQNELDILETTSIALSLELEQLHHDVEQRALELEHMALYDVLTGLANRRMFIEQLKTLTGESQAKPSKTLNANDASAQENTDRFAVVFIDLDDFKRINDTLGHDVGDELLISVSDRLNRLVRETDIVARLGGDEFTLILTPLESTAQAEKTLADILTHFKTPILLNGNDYKVSMSIGAAVGPDHGLIADDLMRCADMAMYKSKKNGKNCFFFFTDEMQEVLKNELRFEQELSHAVNSKEFVLYYQPIINLSTSKVVALEALLRWRHPTQGVISADKFIDALENNGQIFALGEQIFELACLGKLYLNNVGMQALRVSLNMSSKQFSDPMLIEKLDSVLTRHKLQARDFQIELTEQTVMTQANKQKKQLAILQEKGFKIAIDEFGTGHSSLAYLRELPLDLLKIDRGFIKDIPEQKRSTEIVSAVTAMAKKLNIKVIVTGIEKAAQEQFSKTIDCEFAQGDFYCAPQPLEALMTDLQRKLEVITERD